MTFSARKAIDDADLAPYEFEDSQGNPQVLPNMKALSTKQGMQILADGEVEEVIDELAPGLGAEITSWPIHVAEQFVADWARHSGVILPGGEPGKSSAPSASSPSTAARSKRTSRSGGSHSRR